MLPSQEEICSLSLEDFCQRVKEAKQVRFLSATENEFIIKAKRKIINRLAAQESRNRQKRLIVDLRKNIEILEKGLDFSSHVCSSLLTTNQVNEQRVKALEKKCHSLRLKCREVGVNIDDDDSTLSM